MYKDHILAAVMLHNPPSPTSRFSEKYYIKAVINIWLKVFYMHSTDSYKNKTLLKQPLVRIH